MKNRNKSMPEVNAKIKLSIDIIQQKFNKNSPFNSENEQFDILEEKPIKNINTFAEPDIENQQYSVKKTKNNNYFENNKIETVIKNNLAIKLYEESNLHQKFNNNFDFTVVKEFKDLKNEILLRKNPLNEIYTKLIKKNVPIYEKVRNFYRIIHMNNKNSNEIFPILAEQKFNDSIQSDIIYISSIKSKNNELTFKTKLNRLAEYERTNRSESFQNEYFFFKIESNTNIKQNIIKLGDRSKSLGEGYLLTNKKTAKINNTHKVENYL